MASREQSKYDCFISTKDKDQKRIQTPRHEIPQASITSSDNRSINCPRPLIIDEATVASYQAPKRELPLLHSRQQQRLERKLVLPFL